MEYKYRTVFNLKMLEDVGLGSTASKEIVKIISTNILIDIKSYIQPVL